MSDMNETHGIAQPVRRREDVRFLTGQGRFADDVSQAVWSSPNPSSLVHGASVLAMAVTPMALGPDGLSRPARVWDQKRCALGFD